MKDLGRGIKEYVMTDNLHDENQLDAIIDATPLKYWDQASDLLEKSTGVKLPKTAQIKDTIGKINTVADAVGMGKQPKYTVKELKVKIKLYHKPSKIKIGGMKKKQLEDLLRKLQMYSTQKGTRKPRGFKGAGFLDFFKDIKTDFNSVSKSTLDKYSDKPIVSIEIIRAPIQSFIKPFFNAITFGKFSESIKNRGYDQMFHLGLKLNFAINNMTESVILEKNEVVNLSSSIGNFKNESQSMAVQMKKPIVLKEFINNTINRFGKDNFFKYSARDNNCQHFAISCLQSNGLLTQKNKQFIYQSAEFIFRGMPKYANIISNLATNLGARFDAIIH